MCEILSLSYYGETLLKIDKHKKLCLEAHLLVLLYIAEAKLCILSWLLLIHLNLTSLLLGWVMGPSKW
jgi:hypothetical protein